MKRNTAIKLMIAGMIMIMCLNSCTPADSESVSDRSEDISQEEVSQPETPRPVDRTGEKVLLSMGKSYTSPGNSHAQYSDDGKMMTDGDMLYSFAGWGNSVNTFVIDLGERVENIAAFDIVMMGDNWGITLGDTVVYSVSDDNVNWTEAGRVDPDGVAVEDAGEWNVYNYSYESENYISGRYVRMTVWGTNVTPNYAWVCELCVWGYAAPLEALDPHVFSGTETFNNLNTANLDKMGDADGPAYCVYSNTGYNKASFDIELSRAELNIYDKNGTHVNAYAFMGMDVYSGGSWVNCIDFGLVYSSDRTGWHVFYSIYDKPEGEYGWYESGIKLNPNHDYRLTLDSSEKDGECTLTVYDLTAKTVADTASAPLLNAKKDGSNTSFLVDVALDFPSEIQVDENGNKNSTRWISVIRANTDKGYYFRNVGIYNCTLSLGETDYDWTVERTQCRGIWPSSACDTGYEVTTVRNADGNREYIIDLDMNR